MSLDSAQSQRGAAPAGAGPMAQVMGRRWMVSVGHPLAAQAAARILEAGGNAIDAGVAAGFMLGVVHPDMVSFAGVAPILVHQLFEMIGQIHQRLGTAVLLVEQNVNEALRMTAEVYVLEEGRVVFQGASGEKDQIVRHLWRLTQDERASAGN